MDLHLSSLPQRCQNPPRGPPHCQGQGRQQSDHHGDERRPHERGYLSLLVAHVGPYQIV